MAREYVHGDLADLTTDEGVTGCEWGLLPTGVGIICDRAIAKLRWDDRAGDLGGFVPVCAACAELPVIPGAHDCCTLGLVIDWPYGEVQACIGCSVAGRGFGVRGAPATLTGRGITTDDDAAIEFADRALEFVRDVAELLLLPGRRRRDMPALLMVPEIEGKLRALLATRKTGE